MNIQDTNNSDSLDPAEMGLLPKIWGPPTWDSNHAYTFGYPLHPTDEDKLHFRTHFENMGYVLPCCECSKSFINFVSTGETKLTDHCLENRKNLTYWLWFVHKKVCDKVGTVYDITYEMLCEKYESYRATTCESTPENTANAFCNMYNKEAPIFLDAKYFSKFATYRGTKNFDNKLDRISKCSKNSQEWRQRNKDVWKIIKYMRVNAISATEKYKNCDGVVIEVPTVLELELIKRMSTSLSNKRIQKILNDIKKFNN